MPEPPDDGVRWLAGVLAELFKTGLALIVRRYPEFREKRVCPKCDWRF